MQIEISVGFKAYIHPCQEPFIKKLFESEMNRINKSVSDETLKTVLYVLK